MSGKGGLDKVSEVIGNGAKSVQEGLNKMADNFTKFSYTEAAKPYISSGNKIAEGASVAFNGLSKLADKATAVSTGGVKKPDVERQAATTKSTTIDFTPLKVQGDINFNLKNTDGSMTKLTQDQINQLLNSEDFQKKFRTLFNDMKMSGNYANMPSTGG